MLKSLTIIPINMQRISIARYKQMQYHVVYCYWPQDSRTYFRTLDYMLYLTVARHLSRLFCLCSFGTSKNPLTQYLLYIPLFRDSLICFQSRVSDTCSHLFFGDVANSPMTSPIHWPRIVLNSCHTCASPCSRLFDQLKNKTPSVCLLSLWICFITFLLFCSNS